MLKKIHAKTDTSRVSASIRKMLLQQGHFASAIEENEWEREKGMHKIGVARDRDARRRSGIGCPIKYIMSLSLSRYSSRAIARNDRAATSECI